MNDSQRARLERQILAERKRLSEDLDRVASGQRDTVGDRPRLRDDAEASSAGGSLDDDRASMTHTVRELAELDDALRQLREDPVHFGRCATCGATIPMERLRLVPGTRHCVAHAPH